MNTKKKINKETENVEGKDASAQKKKSRFGKKFWAIICSVIVVLVAGLSVGLYFALRYDFNLDGKYIANFSQYSAMGAGTEGQTDLEVNGSGFVTAMSNDEDVDMRLLGQKANGEVEELRVSSKRNGKGKKINWNVYAFYSFNNFSVVQFTKSKVSGYNTDSFYMYPANGNYIALIDNRTGKIYSLESLMENKKSSFTVYFSGIIDESEANESEDSLYFYTQESYYIEEDQILINKLYKATVVGEDLQVTELFDISNGANMVDFYAYKVDKYGNVFLSNWDYTGAYVYTTQGKFRSVKEDIFLSLNGIIYTEDGKYLFDENGNKVENTFDGFKFFVSKDFLVKKVGNVEYYYQYLGHYISSIHDKVFKVTWENDVEFSMEEIPLEDYTQDCVVTRDKLYFREENEVFAIDVETGAKEEVSSSYIFTSIEADNLGNVVFTALNGNMDTVTGIISSDGTIQVGVKESRYKVYYFKPLN